MSRTNEEKIAYLTARLENLQQELEQVRARAKEDRNASSTHDNELSEQISEIVKELQALQGQVSSDRSFVRGVRYILYVLAAIVTLRLGDIPELIMKLKGGQ